MAPRPIIIDTDPGQDDAVAILLALASPELELLGLTTVAGNVPLPLTTRNARIVCELAGRSDMPVFAGCPRPMLRPLHTAEDVHGATGLDGIVRPEPVMPVRPEHAVDWLVATLMAAPERSITLCAIGPLTNIALAIIQQPAIVPRLAEIVLMGGAAFQGGNTTPAAEFNILVDPHAAHVVLEAAAAEAVPLVMVPLDCTHKALMTEARIGRLRAAGGRVSAAVADLLEAYGRYDRRKYGTLGGPLHDPCTIAWLIEPELFAGRRCAVAVETASPLTLGMTVVDWWGVTGRPPNALVLDHVDADGFVDLIAGRLARL